LIGLRVAAGELIDACVELAGALIAGLDTGNANVGDGKGDGVPDALGKGDAVALGDEEGFGVELGVGDGMIFSQ
jgi:hypothetical protein